MSATNRTSGRGAILWVLGVLVAAASVPSVSTAANTNWDAAVDTWFDAGNWDNGLPDATKYADIDNGGTALIDQALAGNALALDLYIGRDHSGKVRQTDGALIVGPWPAGGGFVLGAMPAGTGTYELVDGSVSAPYQWVGSSGSGVFTQSGGTNTAASELHLGSWIAASSGTYTLSGGADSAIG